ncbi:MAG: GNAT family N-acetyltransferase [Thermosynechococcaceae cyanobacterium]
MTAPMPSGSISLPRLPIAVPVHIRRVKEQDLLSIAHLLCTSFYPETSYWHWAVPLLRVGIYQDLRSRFVTQLSRHACFVATLKSSTPPGESAQETLVGTVEVTLKSLWLWQPPVPYISNLAVLPSYRRQGIAQNLLLTCEPVARSWSANDLYLNVLKTNAAAQSLYQKIDYSPEESKLWPFGPSKRLLLRKRLAPVQSCS